MLDTDRIARLASAVIVEFGKKNLTPFEMQETLIVAMSLAQIEVARAQREAQASLLEIQRNLSQPKDVQYEAQHNHD